METNPDTGVEQPSVEQRLVSFFAKQGKPTAPPPPVAAEPTADAEEVPAEAAEQAEPEEVLEA